MYKLINDVIQYSDAVDTLKSPSLADITEETSFTITLDATYDIDCIGVGNTDSLNITINGEVVTLDTGIDKNGLYLLTTPLNTNTLTISHTGTYIGRIAVGKYQDIGSTYSRTTGFYSTSVPRDTASGQVISGAGGITGRTVSAVFTYKIIQEIFDDLNSAYSTQIGKGFPFFLFFDEEDYRQPVKRFYGSTDVNLLFDSDLISNKYSIELNYREKF